MGTGLRLGCIFLASGFSRRFGENKLLAIFRGKPLADLVFERFPAELFCRTVVVTRYASVAVSAAERGFCVVENDDPSGDIAETIRLGLLAFDHSFDGCLFSVCDQPFVRAQSIQALVERFVQEPQAIVALGYGGKRGNPVLFPRVLFDELSALNPHQSGGAVIARHPERLRIVETGGPQELFDIDYPADLAGPNG